jgi:hypothetical protein
MLIFDPVHEDGIDQVSELHNLFDADWGIRII